MPNVLFNGDTTSIGWTVTQLESRTLEQSPNTNASKYKKGMHLRIKGRLAKICGTKAVVRKLLHYYDGGFSIQCTVYPPNGHQGIFTFYEEEVEIVKHLWEPDDNPIIDKIHELEYRFKEKRKHYMELKKNMRQA